MSQFTRKSVFALCISVAVAFTAAPAFSAGSGSSGGSSDTPVTSPKKLKCKRGEVVKTVTVNGSKVKKCVKRTAALLSDDELYAQGRALAKEGEYEWALDLLTSIKSQDDPKVLNYIGYSHRKAGRLETGFAFYKKALALNPDFVLAREYLGEGYVAAGRVDLAKLELAEIGKRCGVTCSEYTDLAGVIATASN